MLKNRIKKLLTLLKTISLKRHIAKAMLRINPYWPFTFLNKLPYYLCIWLMRLSYRSLREIEAVYIMHDLDSYDWVPGSSDIDTRIIIKHMEANEEFMVLRNFWKKHSCIARIFHIIPYGGGSTPICDTQQLTDPGFLSATSGWGIIPVSWWKLLYGNDIRQVIPKYTKKIRDRYPLNINLQKVLPEHFITPLLENRSLYANYLRSPCRLVLKVLEYIYLRENNTPEASEIQIKDFFHRKSIPGINFLLSQIDEIKMAGYFVKNSEEAEKHLMYFSYGLIKLLDYYHASLLSNTTSDTEKECSLHQQSNSQFSIPEEINKFIKKISLFLQCIESVICCAQHHCTPFKSNSNNYGVFDLHLVISNDIDLGNFKIFLKYLRHEFRQSNFEYTVKIFIYTRNIFLSQEYGLSNEFALHLFHLRSCGVCLYGDNLIAELTTPPKYILREAVIRGIAIQSMRRLKCYPSNYFVGQSCAVAQQLIYTLLSYRLFLEKDIIVTLSKEILNNYLSNFTQEELSQEIKTISELSPDVKITKEFLEYYYLTAKSLLKMMGH